jgi:hypothetical protein
MAARVVGRKTSQGVARNRHGARHGAAQISGYRRLPDAGRSGQNDEPPSFLHSAQPFTDSHGLYSRIRLDLNGHVSVNCLA